MKEGNMRVFSSEYGDALKTKGFFTTPLLEKEELAELEKLFYRYFKEDALPVFFDSLTGVTNATVRRELHNSILDICKPYLNKIISDFFPVIAMFYTKKSGEESELGLHIDPSMTLEKFNHWGVWIPLSGANETTGKMCFLSGTQNVALPYHALTIENPYRNISGKLKPLMECVEVAPGEAIFFDNNLLHYTQKNVSGKLRVSVIIKVIDNNAPVVSAFLNKNQGQPIIEFYQNEPDYYVSDYFQQKDYPHKSTKLNFTLPQPVSFSDSDLEKIKNIP